MFFVNHGVFIKHPKTFKSNLFHLKLLLENTFSNHLIIHWNETDMDDQ